MLSAAEGDLTGKQFSLVLERPPKNPTTNQTDPDAVAALNEALANEFTQAWALTRSDKDTTAWLFRSVYHIKVAVRDLAAFWLTSGNWNNSNQPDIDPAATRSTPRRPGTATGTGMWWSSRPSWPGCSRITSSTT